MLIYKNHSSNMPQYTIAQGDTLSRIAQANKTSVAELMALNKNNPAVKSQDLILAGGSLNLPDSITSSSPQLIQGSPSGNTGGTGNSIDTGSVQPMGDLGNLRIALRSALNEAGRRRVENNFRTVAPSLTGVPGTVGSVVDMIRGGIKAPVETVFSDILTGYKEASTAKQKEIDRINELREEYGSLVPSNVKDLATALDFIAPSVDKERKIKLEKLAEEQAADNDIESWAESYAKGEVSIGNVPAKIRTAVKVRSDSIIAELEASAKKEYQDRIVFRIQNKISDYETERELVMQDDNLTVAEQRQVLDYIDGLEEAQKTTKAEGRKSLFNNTPSPMSRTQTTTSDTLLPNPSDSSKLFGNNFVQPFKEAFKLSALPPVT